MTNPLLKPSHVDERGLPAFASIRAEHVEPAIRQLIEEGRALLERLLAQPQHSWDSLVVPLEEQQHRLTRTWSPIGHLNGVLNSEALRAAYNQCLPLLTAWNTDLAQDERLYQAYQDILQRQAEQLNPAQRKLLQNALRDFRLAGIGLPQQRKQQFKALMEQLAVLQAKFEENVLDATNAWTRHITDESQLAGLPEVFRARARAAAQARELPGWLFTLDAPNYQAIMTHAQHEPLRRELYEAWVTRASDVGASAERWDNSQLMVQILGARRELAELVGFANFAEYSLATKMASSVSEVQTFLQQLAAQSKPVAQRELEELSSFAGRPLQAWDLAFYAEQLKKQRFDLSEDLLRPYFPLPRVLAGLFAVAERLYGIRIARRHDVEVYHPDVQFYEILDASGGTRGGFFIDLYARAQKRGGAWMDECIGRKRLGGSLVTPVAYLVCNFSPPMSAPVANAAANAGAETQPSLLTHSEVVTLFHEFGHGLHHMLTQVDYPSVAGINGVAWDAVELPSQFMENFAWRAEVLPLISSHVVTGESLPAAELERLLGSRTFHAGMHTVRQLEFALFDLRIHGEWPAVERSGAASIDSVMRILSEVRREVAVVQPPAFNRFAHSFQHIFSGGYAAGYYSYKWAEVLAADAFSAFEEQGIFNQGVARRFLAAILERGGSLDALDDAFVEFRGRKPEIAPLLRQLGLAA
jgi:oligopeptidase A